VSTVWILRGRLDGRRHEGRPVICRKLTPVNIGRRAGWTTRCAGAEAVGGAVLAIRPADRAVSSGESEILQADEAPLWRGLC